MASSERFDPQNGLKTPTMSSFGTPTSFSGSSEMFPSNIHFSLEDIVKRRLADEESEEDRAIQEEVSFKISVRPISISSDTTIS